MSVYELRLLGRPQLTRDGEAVTLQSRGAGLLAYLSRQPQGRASRDQLCSLLWPDEATENARHSLRQLVWSLRQAAGDDLLSVTRDSIGLQDDVYLDVNAFVQGLEPTETPGATENAIAFYNGFFMEACQAAGGAEFEDWLLGEREYLHRLFSRHALALAQDGSANAIALLESLLRFDPLDETVVEELMIRYEATGERRLALRVYRSFVAALERELNAEPPDHIRAIAHRLGRAEPKLSLEQQVGGPDSPAPTRPNTPNPERLSLCALVYVVFQTENAWETLSVKERVRLLGECHYLSERVASRFGAEGAESRGNGHLFVFGTPALAADFGLKLWEAWTSATTSIPADMLTLRIAAHAGEATQMSQGQTWIGRGVQTAYRVAAARPWQGLVVTENLLDLLPVVKYEGIASERMSLDGDYLPERTLYVLALSSRRDVPVSAHQRVQNLFLRAVSYVATPQENGPDEESAYRQVVELDPRHAEAHNNLAVLLRRRGQEHEAAVHYRAALAIRPGYAEAHYNYAVLLEATGNVNAALEHFRTALQIRPDYIDVHLRYAVLQVRRGQYDDARRRYERVLQLRPAYAEAHNNFAILLEDLGDRDGAKKHYRLAIESKQDYVEAHYNLALHFEVDGDETEAATHYMLALDLSPGFAEARSNFASLLFRQGRMQEALAHYRLAVEARPNDPEANYNYAIALQAVGEHAAAEQYFNIARDFTPSGVPFASTIERPSRR